MIALCILLGTSIVELIVSILICIPSKNVDDFFFHTITFLFISGSIQSDYVNWHGANLIEVWIP